MDSFKENILLFFSENVLKLRSTFKQLLPSLAHLNVDVKEIPENAEINSAQRLSENENEVFDLAKVNDDDLSKSCGSFMISEHQEKIDKSEKLGLNKVIGTEVFPEQYAFAVAIQNKTGNLAASGQLDPDLLDRETGKIHLRREYATQKRRRTKKDDPSEYRRQRKTTRREAAGSTKHRHKFLLPALVFMTCFSSAYSEFLIGIRGMSFTFKKNSVFKETDVIYNSNGEMITIVLKGELKEIGKSLGFEITDEKHLKIFAVYQRNEGIYCFETVKNLSCHNFTTIEALTSSEPSQPTTTSSLSKGEKSSLTSSEPSQPTTTSSLSKGEKSSSSKCQTLCVVGIIIVTVIVINVFLMCVFLVYYNRGSARNGENSNEITNKKKLNDKFPWLKNLLPCMNSTKVTAFKALKICLWILLFIFIGFILFPILFLCNKRQIGSQESSDSRLNEKKDEKSFFGVR